MFDTQPGWRDITQSNAANVSVNDTIGSPTAEMTRSRRAFAGDGSFR